jgi:uncharacterized protein
MKRYTIYLTKQCNCRCKYCYQGNYNNTYSWQNIKQQLDNVVSKGKTDIKIVEFIGGEPFLVFALLEKSYNYLNSIDKNIIYYISTNGTIINKYIVNFIRFFK